MWYNSCTTAHFDKARRYFKLLNQTEEELRLLLAEAQSENDDFSHFQFKGETNIWESVHFQATLTHIFLSVFSSSQTQTENGEKAATIETEVVASRSDLNYIPGWKPLLWRKGG